MKMTITEFDSQILSASRHLPFIVTLIDNYLYYRNDLNHGTIVFLIYHYRFPECRKPVLRSNNTDIIQLVHLHDGMILLATWCDYLCMNPCDYSYIDT